MLKFILLLPVKITLSPVHFVLHLIFLKRFIQQQEWMAENVPFIGQYINGYVYLFLGFLFLWPLYLGFAIAGQLLATLIWILTNNKPGDGFMDSK
tara:strand:- start:104 stop:388 length:285 start_codon:yes stop_codon:yes gene_type:complete